MLIPYVKIKQKIMQHGEGTEVNFCSIPKWECRILGLAAGTREVRQRSKRSRLLLYRPVSWANRQMMPLLQDNKKETIIPK